MKTLASLAFALLFAAPAFAQDHSASVSIGPITAGRMISISVGGTSDGGAMAARIRVSGSYQFQQTGNAAPVVTVSPFAPIVTFAKNGNVTGGASVTQTIPGQSFNVSIGSPPAAAAAFRAPSFFSAPRGFFGN